MAEPNEEITEQADGDTASARALLEHTHKAWSAEEENAARIQRERQVSTTILLALFGAGFAGAAKWLPNCDGWSFWLAIVFLATALFFCVEAFLFLVPTSKPEDRESRQDDKIDCATMHLRLPENVFKHEPSEYVAITLSYLAFYNAFTDLQERNDKVKERVRAGAGSIVTALAIGIIGLTIALFDQPSISDVELGTGVTQDAISSPQEHRHEHYHFQGELYRRPEAGGRTVQKSGQASPSKDDSIGQEQSEVDSSVGEEN